VRETAVARNYAEALFAVGEREGASEEFGGLLDGLGGAITSDERLQVVMESPRVPKARRLAIVRRALTDVTPTLFLRWVEAVIRRGRGGLFAAISEEYHALLDVKFHRVQAGITLARPADAGFKEAITRRLSEALRVTVVPAFRENPDILGGVVVRIGDRVIDGSVRRRMRALRRQMLGG
jgi:F-type H+-transporting ATPase subunit delta